MGATIFGATGCATAPATTVQRVDPNQQIDLSGNWNDTDANQVAQAMIQDCLARPWAAKYKAETGKDPIIKLYLIRNRSDEHINDKFFTKQVERELLNSGVVQVVAAVDEVWDARAERTDQAAHASDETKKEHQQEAGTDFIMNGWINIAHDREGGQEVRAYLINMELIQVESQRKVWIGEKKIKKVVNRAEHTW